MDKYKIIALFGPAGSGKDYIQKSIMQTHYGKGYLNEIISCTTRPPREGEKDGVDYYFVTKEEFMKKRKIEYTEFNGWLYGTPIENLKINKINIGVFNIDGLCQLLDPEYSGNNVDCFPIYIKAYPKIRLLRQLQREANPNCEEIARRFLADQKDFLNIPFHYHIIFNNTDEVKPIIHDIIKLAECMDKIN